MKLLDLLRKGLGFVLLSIGVSRPAPKPRPTAGSSPPETGRQIPRRISPTAPKATHPES